MGNNESELPDGLYAVENDISEIYIYYGGEMLEIEKDSYIYSFFKSQISNCGGHVLGNFLFRVQTEFYTILTRTSYIGETRLMSIVWIIRRWGMSCKNIRKKY